MDLIGLPRVGAWAAGTASSAASATAAATRRNPVETLIILRLPVPRGLFPALFCKFDAGYLTPPARRTTRQGRQPLILLDVPHLQHRRGDEAAQSLAVGGRNRDLSDR